RRVLHRRLLLRHVDGRAGDGVRHRQRHFHHSVRRHPVPDPHLCQLSVQRRGELGQRRRCRGRCAAPGSGGVAAGGRPGAGCVRRVHQRRRAPHSRPVCQAAGGPEDVRRPELSPPHEGEYV
ncbi:RNA polymerase sigma factor, sigma-70 family, partial [Dysosmobacter welbionis]